MLTNFGAKYRNKILCDDNRLFFDNYEKLILLHNKLRFIEFLHQVGLLAPWSMKVKNKEDLLFQHTLDELLKNWKKEFTT